MMGRLAERVCFVTGGASGIGAAIVKKLVEDGATVVAADINFEAAQAFVESLGAPSKHVVPVRLDVRDADAFRAAVQKTADDFGNVHALFNNAGTGGQSALDDITRERFDNMMAINAFSVVAGTQAAAAVMRKQSFGKIINTCSIAGRKAFPGHVLYAATKFAVRAMTQGFAQELGGSNITVNAICPGMVHTPLWDPFSEDGVSGASLVDLYASGAALGRAAVPADIAGLAAFLASADSDYMTGQMITVDGGIIFD